MTGLTIGPSVMLKLGSFQFSIGTAAYQELSRKATYNWASQDRFGRMPNLQFVGKGEETISLAGVIYPDYRGGFAQLDRMREIAGQGLPQLLIDGSGKLLGRWVILSVDEKQSTFAAAGMPRKQEFTLELKKREA